VYQAAAGYLLGLPGLGAAYMVAVNIQHGDWKECTVGLSKRRFISATSNANAGGQLS
jgi:hypothetical protein